MAIYTYDDLNKAVNNRLHNKIGKVTDSLASINTAVKQLWGQVNLRTAKRKSTLSPRLFSDVYSYACPSDLKGFGLIDIRPQATDAKPEWSLVPDEEFERKKSEGNDVVAIRDADGTRRIMISTLIDDDSSVVSELDSLTSGGGTWTLFGDGTNLTKDADNYVHGSASINWDISSAGGTTAGIYNSGLTSFDITDYLTAGSAFMWVYLYSATNVTNFIIRVGSDSSNYYSVTVTSANDSTAFVAGWQLLRFDFSGKSTTGTVDDDACDYVALYMTKAAGKVSETDYRFDYLVLRKGDIWEVNYYTKYPWQSSAGAYKQDATTSTDYLNVDADEYNLVVEQCVEYLGKIVREYEDAKDASNTLNNLLLPSYQSRYPSEALTYASTYYNFGSIGGDWWTG